MNYQVLARKWRPQTFAEVIGQKHVLTTLVNSLSLKRIHHAYLFSGTRGIGKTSIARLLVKCLNCETDITATPCGVCNNCREITQGCFVDLIEIDGASKTKVEDTRDLLDNIQYAPVHSRFKVYLIDEVHMLSRHSFNALLKTLEEPPVHVKFLLATTDPQKLPMTILSRCLQFHLRALDVEQIHAQLEHILNAENIMHEPYALQLLARAADGSLRDALNLTDQAIATGGGKLSTKTVSTMLGTMNADQALSLVEAIINADGERTLSLINEATMCGTEWEALLIEMLSLLHHLAMLQLSSSTISSNMKTIEQRLLDLARTVPPTDIQLYYQILLIGRKELPFAPDRRMGVEMTMLRALAFHPNTPFLKTEATHQTFTSVTPTTEITTQKTPQSTLPSKLDIQLSDTSNSVSTSYNQFQHPQGTTKLKKNESLIPNRAKLVNNTTLKQLTSVREHIQSRSILPVLKQKDQLKKEIYCYKAGIINKETKIKLVPSEILKQGIKHEKTPALAVKLAEETIIRDTWAAEISQLQLPKQVKLVALNAWKEQEGDQICLHLRSDQWYLNSSSTQRTLAKALTILNGSVIKLTIIKDDNFEVRTPLEWNQAIYEEKLAQAYKIIIADNNVKNMLRLFNANLDEKSIRPI